MLVSYELCVWNRNRVLPFRFEDGNSTNPYFKGTGQKKKKKNVPRVTEPLAAGDDPIDPTVTETLSKTRSAFVFGCSEEQPWSVTDTDLWTNGDSRLAPPNTVAAAGLFDDEFGRRGIRRNSSGFSVNIEIARGAITAE